MRILYCTDHGPDTYLLKALRELQHAVNAFAGVDAGLAAAELGDWAAVICDLKQADDRAVRLFSTAAAEAWLLVISAAAPSMSNAALLRAGADAVFLRPYAFLEISAKLDALGRRALSVPVPAGSTVQLELIPADRAVRLNGERIELSRREFALLAFLAARPGAVVANTVILDAIWADVADARPARLHSTVSALRAKLERGRGLRVLHSLPGQGYALRLDG